MPDCPNCGTWNPEDKNVCWRCQTELPKPKQTVKREPMRFLGLPLWTWAVVALFFILMFAGQCFIAPNLVGG